MKLRKNERRKSLSILSQRLKYGYFDTETYTLTNDDFTEIKDFRVYAIGGLNDKGQYKSRFNPKTALRDFVNDLAKQTGEITLGCHNASFDLPFIIREIVEGGHELKDGYAKFTEDGILIGSTFSGPHLTVRVGCTGFGDKTMRVADGSQVIGKTKKLALTDYTKYNIDEKLNYFDNEKTFKIFNKELEIEYLHNDVAILPEIIEKIDEQKTGLGALTGFDLKGVYMKRKRFISSNAGAAKDCYSNAVGLDFDSHYRPEIPADLYEKIENGYLGGFTSGNPKFFELNDPRIRVFDINSMYPSIMNEGIPYGVPTQARPSSGDFITGVECTGSFCNGKEKYNFFDNEFLGKTFFDEINDGDTFILLLETFNLAKEMCDNDLEIVSYGYQDRCHKMAEFIRINYEERCNLKAQMKSLTGSKGQDANNKQESIKIVLNSLYGKLAERYHPRYKEISKADPYLREKENVLSGPCILAGSYVTARARCILLKAIKAEVELGNEFIYCDTDSIFIIDKTGKRAIQIDSSKLGHGKLEGEYDTFRYLGKHKKYLLYNREVFNKLVKEVPKKELFDDKNLSKFVKLAFSGIPCKDEVIRGNLQDLEKLFDRRNCVRFIFSKVAPITVDERFGIDALRQTHYDTNPMTAKVNGKKTRIFTHYVLPPYTKIKACQHHEEKEAL